MVWNDLCLNANTKSCPFVIESVLQGFKDVFPDELPGELPQLRGIEHQIEFVPSSSLPNRAVYKANPMETQELQRQVEGPCQRFDPRISLTLCHSRDFSLKERW